MDILVGHTGFVGQNLNRQYSFTATFNSKNISDAYGTLPDLCVYCGTRAEKFRADNFPDEDLAHMNETINNIRQINPKRLVLISTVDVIPSTQEADVYEDTGYNTDKLTSYGKNRLYLENEIRKTYPDALIIRLPALFGLGLKKNFIFDLISYSPAMLRKDKFYELRGKEPLLAKFYREDVNGFYRMLPDISPDDKVNLKKIFENLGFSALNFTDSRSKFAFYNLDYLWGHIQKLMEVGVRLAHLTTEPISAAEVYKGLHDKDFVNEVASQPFDYTFFKTRHAELFGGSGAWIFGRETILKEISSFVKKHELQSRSML